MIKALLINQKKIPHYRIRVYNYLCTYLKRKNYRLTIVSEGTEEVNTHQIEFDHRVIRLSFLKLAKVIIELDPDVIIYCVNLRHLFLFPMLLLTKILRKKAVYWGHGVDLLGERVMRLKYFFYSMEHWLSDAIILFGGHLRKNVKSQFHDKVFIANNTLHFDKYEIRVTDKNDFLSKYHISTSKNIICTGRMQKRKRLDHLFKAFELLNRRDIGLILVGPDCDGILRDFYGDNIYKLGPIYGKEMLDLLSAADVLCLPGAVGLSIVDAFYCGLPIVTEDGDVSPEIMYLKDGINGFVVQRGNVQQLAERIELLLDDDKLREKFSRAAKNEISTNGHIDNLCRGFTDALRYIFR